MNASDDSSADSYDKNLLALFYGLCPLRTSSAVRERPCERPNINIRPTVYLCCTVNIASQANKQLQLQGATHEPLSPQQLRHHQAF